MSSVNVKFGRGNAARARGGLRQCCRMQISVIVLYENTRDSTSRADVTERERGLSYSSIMKRWKRDATSEKMRINIRNVRARARISVTCALLSFDRDKRKITISVKKCTSDEFALINASNRGKSSVTADVVKASA